MKSVVIRGIVTMNFELEIEPEQFQKICDEKGLSPYDIENFTNDNWLEIRGLISDLVSESESDLDFGDVYDHNSISVDEVTVQNQDIITCLYEQGDAVHSVEIS